MSNDAALHDIRTDAHLGDRCEAVAIKTVATLRDVEGIDTSAWVTIVRIALDPQKGFDDTDFTYAFGTKPDEVDATVDLELFEEARYEEEVCLVAGMDSHEAVATWAGLLLGIAPDYCPKGGGVYDAKYGVIVSTVGLPPLMALFVSRTVRDYYVAKLDEAAMRMFAAVASPVTDNSQLSPAQRGGPEPGVELTAEQVARRRENFRP